MSKDRPADTHTDALGVGISALIKSLLLVFGVPAAVFRLCQLSSAPSQDSHLALIIHLLLVGVAMCWIVAVGQLGGEIRHALHSPEQRLSVSWSSTWASGIVGLLLLAGALAVQTGSSQRPAQSTQTLGNEQILTRGGSATTKHHVVVVDDLVVGLGLLTAAALIRRTRLLARLRTSLRAPYARTPPLSADLQMLLRNLESSTDETALDWIEATNRFLGSRFIGAETHDIPEIALMRVGNEGIELLLERPIEFAPAPFSAKQHGWWWQLDADCNLATLQRLGHHGPRLAPWLIPLGDDGTAQILLALGPGRALGIIGAVNTVDDALRGLITGLRVLPWCDELSIELCGIDAPPLHDQSMHMQCSSIQTLNDLVDSPRGARTAMHDNWRREPLVVIHRKAIKEGSRAALIAIEHGCGALVADQMPSLNLRLNSNSACLEPFGITMDLQLLSGEHESIVNRLLDAYAQPTEIVNFHESPQAHYREDCPVESCEIAILGPVVEIRGAQRQPHRDDEQRVQELLVFLALHNYQANISEILDALFIASDTTIVRPRLENLIALCRATLGRSPCGSERVRRSGDDVVLDCSVALDWHRLENATLKAQSLNGKDAITLLQDALGWCSTGPLLGGVVAYRWFRTMRYGEYITSTVIDACHHLATLANSTDTRDIANWAIQIGRQIEPASEIMARDLMVILDAEGYPDEITAVYTQLQRELVTLGDAEPSAITQQLYLTLVPQAKYLP